MIDPCEECIVLPCCEQICEPRKNYTSLCRDAVKWHEIYSDNISKMTGARYFSEYRKASERLDDVYKRNRTLIKPSMSTTSSGGGSSLSYTSFLSSDMIHVSYMEQAGRNLAKKIDEEIMQTLINELHTPKQYQRRKR